MPDRPAPSSACTASAPRRRCTDVLAKFGFVPDKIGQTAKTQIAENKNSGAQLPGTADNECSQSAARSRPGGMARFPVARLHRQRRTEEACRRRRPARGDVEPVDLRARHRPFRRIRRRHRRHAETAGPLGRRIFEHARGRGHPESNRRAAPVFEATGGADGFVSIEVSPYLAMDTKATHRRSEAAVARGRPQKPDDQGAGDAGRPARHPRPDCRRHQRQHHAVIRAIGLRTGGRGLSGGTGSAGGARRRRLADRAASRASSSAASIPRSTNCSTKKSPRANDPDEKAPPRRAQGQGRRRQCQARLSALPAAVRRRSLAGAQGQRRQAAAAVVGVDRHQEQGLQRRPLCRGIDRPRHRQHHAGADDGCVPRSRQGCATASTENVADAQRHA